MLRACKRLLRPGGGIAFYTIFIPPGLSESAYRRAMKLGPPRAGSRRREHEEPLPLAGFVKVSGTDLTSEVLRISPSCPGAAAPRQLRTRAPGKLPPRHRNPMPLEYPDQL